MFGALLAVLTYYGRMKMPKTAHYIALVVEIARWATSDMSRVLQMDIQPEQENLEQQLQRLNLFSLFSKEFLRRHSFHLLGTTTRWLLLDIAFYSQILFQNNISIAIGWIPSAETMNALEEWLTCHGISAAAAKAGAIVGAFGFLYAAQSRDPKKTDHGYLPGIGVKNALILLGVTNALGLLFTFLVRESKGQSLEEMSGENEQGEENGTDVVTVELQFGDDGH
ncbi:hypothetical protein AAC387_Pa02g0552 [Persea americana]